MNNSSAASQQTSSLEPRSIIDLSYNFRIPSYQRGYRWEKRQITELLDDIAKSDSSVPYYLQPIVVAPTISIECNGKKIDYDIIDGQQRLTTVYLIFKAFNNIIKATSQQEIANLANSGKLQELESLMRLSSELKKFDSPIGFEIFYQTRKSSHDFLENIASYEKQDSVITESPDHLYMWHAFQTINKWLYSSEITDVSALAKALTTRVKVIWYELPSTIPNWKKFTDLNIGKIPLTNSELIKALFLRTKNFSGSDEKESEEYDKQTLVAQWDQIEREMSDPDFWGFLTRERPEKYATKIDLLFELIAGKTDQDKNDKLFSFNFFVDWFKTHNQLTSKKKWEEIYLQYQRLRDWYLNREIYHFLGYLVAIDFPHKALFRIFRFAHPNNPKRRNRSTKTIKKVINRFVKISLHLPKTIPSFKDLKYNSADDPTKKIDTSHHELIKRYLTLYNIMVTLAASKTLRYPFAYHNNVGGGWSLEHIHAQKSEVLNKWTQWNEWILSHKSSLDRLSKTISPSDKQLTDKIKSLSQRMDKFSKDSDRNTFNSIADDFRKIIESLPGAGGLYQDEIANLALLGKYDNSTLNNSTFDVKRQKIIEMLGTNFVPIGTERVFLKAIFGQTEQDIGGVKTLVKYQCDSEHLFFWGNDDREAYLNDISEKLKLFL